MSGMLAGFHLHVSGLRSAWRPIDETCLPRIARQQKGLAIEPEWTSADEMLDGSPTILKFFGQLAKSLQSAEESWHPSPRHRFDPGKGLAAFSRPSSHGHKAKSHLFPRAPSVSWSQARWPESYESEIYLGTRDNKPRTFLQQREVLRTVCS